MTRNQIALVWIRMVGFFLVSLPLAFAQSRADASPLASVQTQKKIDDSAIRFTTSLVNLDISVLDRQRNPMTGLAKEHFEVYEDGIRQTIELFAVRDAPASIGVILDCSSSMQRHLNQARAALRAFIENSHPQDEFFLMTFREKPELLADWTQGENLIAPVATLRAEGETGLYDAIASGLEKLADARQARRVLLVLSDGVDTKSRLGYSALSKLMKEAECQLYLIGSEHYSGSNCARLCWFQTQNSLQDLARLTGGEAFFIAAPHQLEAALTQLAVFLRQQYSLAYVPTDPTRKGKWRKIGVKVNLDGKKPIVLSRRGYFDHDLPH